MAAGAKLASRNSILFVVARRKQAVGDVAKIELNRFAELGRPKRGARRGGSAPSAALRGAADGQAAATFDALLAKRAEVDCWLDISRRG